MKSRKYRVVVWSTGGIGSILINSIQNRPDIELVGVWVHSPEKVGRDAGELANGVPIGLTTTGDADALIALKPDCGENPVYRVRIEGEPDIACDMTASLADPTSVGSNMSSGAGAMVSTTMRVVNAIPYVVQAKPGLLTALDMPLTLPKNTLV
jgi:hypothetical protein